MFLSTPPSRVATATAAPLMKRSISFYPRHPRGWRLISYRFGPLWFNVSIHATLAGGDAVPSVMVQGRGLFLSTPPSRVATRENAESARNNAVSIHATLAGGDLPLLHGRFCDNRFLSTPPSRVATEQKAVEVRLAEVSIHATLAGGDVVLFVHFCDIAVSIHATLAGGDHQGAINWQRTASVSIHATLAGGDPG